MLGDFYGCNKARVNTEIHSDTAKILLTIHINL